MTSRLITIILAVASVLVGVSLISVLADVRLPGNNQGYRPEQPLEYSHRLHAGELSIPCLYCHSGAERSRHAGVPPVNVCMNCHKYVTASLGAIREEERLAGEQGREPQPVVAPDLERLFAAWTSGDPEVPGGATAGEPIAWTRIHKLPDYVYFDHRPHVAAGVSCQSCHGPIESMDRVRQYADMTMGWCVDCHRKTGGTRVAGHPVEPSLDCATCHY